MASTAAQKRADLKAAAEKGPVISVKLNGTLHSWLWKDDTALSVRAFRRQAGMSPNQFLAEARVKDGFGIDHAAMVVWMAGERDSTGVPVKTFDDVAAGLIYGDDWDLVSTDEITDDDAVEANRPEA